MAWFKFESEQSQSQRNGTDGLPVIRARDLRKFGKNIPTLADLQILAKGGTLSEEKQKLAESLAGTGTMIYRDKNRGEKAKDWAQNQYELTIHSQVGARKIEREDGMGITVEEGYVPNRLKRAATRIVTLGQKSAKPVITKTTITLVTEEEIGKHFASQTSAASLLGEVLREHRNGNESNGNNSH